MKTAVLALLLLTIVAADFNISQWQSCVNDNAPQSGDITTNVSNLAFSCPAGYQQDTCANSTASLTGLFNNASGTQTQNCSDFWTWYNTSSQDANNTFNSSLAIQCLASDNVSADSNSTYFQDMIWDLLLSCSTTGMPPAPPAQFMNTKDGFQSCSQNCPNPTDPDQSAALDAFNTCVSGDSSVCKASAATLAAQEGNASMAYNFFACEAFCLPELNKTFSNQLFTNLNCKFAQCLTLPTPLTEGQFSIQDYLNCIGNNTSAVPVANSSDYASAIQAISAFIGNTSGETSDQCAAYTTWWYNNQYIRQNAYNVSDNDACLKSIPENLTNTNSTYFNMIYYPVLESCSSSAGVPSVPPNKGNNKDGVEACWATAATCNNQTECQNSENEFEVCINDTTRAVCANAQTQFANLSGDASLPWDFFACVYSCEPQMDTNNTFVQIFDYKYDHCAVPPGPNPQPTPQSGSVLTFVVAQIALLALFLVAI